VRGPKEASRRYVKGAREPDKNTNRQVRRCAFDTLKIAQVDIGELSESLLREIARSAEALDVPGDVLQSLRLVARRHAWRLPCRELHYNGVRSSFWGRRMRVSRASVGLVAAGFAMALGCGGGGAPSREPAEPLRVAIDDVRLRAIMTHAARGASCRALLGRHVPVYDFGGTFRNSDEDRIVGGRWRVTSCTPSDTGEPFTFAVTLAGEGWKYVDVSKGGVHVATYARFSSRITTSEVVDVTTEQADRYVKLELTAKHPHVDVFNLLGSLAYEPTSFGAKVLDFFGGVQGDVDEAGAGEGAALMLARAAQPRTIYFDTCTGQVTADRLSLLSPDGAITVEADRVRLHDRGAIDAAGPFVVGDSPLQFDVYVEPGGGRVLASIACATQVTPVVDGWLAGGMATDPTIAGILMPGFVYPTVARRDACPLVLFVRAIDAPATIRYRVKYERPSSRCR
jgi:hypothetical protein